MSTATAARAVSPWIPPYPVYRFTVDQYHRIIAAGILTENDRVELLEGWIVPKMPRNPPHDATLWFIQTALLSRLPGEWILRIQSAITTEDSEPEPDLAVVRGPGERYSDAHPQPREVGLLIEVADTTVTKDREDMGRLYARARVPIYWIANIPEAIVEVYTQPVAGKSPRYRQRQDFAVPQSVPLVLDGTGVAQIPVRELLR